MEILESQEKERISLKERASSFLFISQPLATGFGIGYLPLAPGTWASLAAALFWLGLYQLPFSGQWIVQAVALAVLFPVSWISASQLSAHMGDDDPSVIVIDEIFGQSLALLAAPVTPINFVMGFILFRIFDIAKPFPVKQAERFHGGLGITMDDLVAGLYAGAILWLINAS